MDEKWKFYKAVVEGEELSVNGLNIWDHNWKSLRQYVSVKDPIYGQDHIMTIYEINDGNMTVTFAAGEFSNLIWGIYLQNQI